MFGLVVLKDREVYAVVSEHADRGSVCAYLESRAVMDVNLILSFALDLSEVPYGKKLSRSIICFKSR